METLTLIITGIYAVGTFLLGITALIGIPKAINNLAVKNETLFGEEAAERYNQIEKKLTKGTAIKLPPIKHGDIIVPRLEVEKISYNAHTTGGGISVSGNYGKGSTFAASVIQICLDDRKLAFAEGADQKRVLVYEEMRYTQV